MPKKYIEPGDRLMDKVWIRDGNNIYTGEAALLACLLHVKKGRTVKAEEELKDILDVYATGA